MVNETTTPIEMSTGFIDSVIRFKILGNRINVYFGGGDISEKIFFKLCISLINAHRLERTLNF